MDSFLFPFLFNLIAFKPAFVISGCRLGAQSHGGSSLSPMARASCLGGIWAFAYS